MSHGARRIRACSCDRLSGDHTPPSLTKDARATRAGVRFSRRWVSNVVRELAKGKDFLFADRGEANLKGFDESVRLYEVRWREEG